MFLYLYCYRPRVICPDPWDFSDRYPQVAHQLKGHSDKCFSRQGGAKLWGGQALGLGPKNWIHRVGPSLRQPSSMPPCFSAFPNKAQSSQLWHPGQQAGLGERPRASARHGRGKELWLGRCAQNTRYCPFGDREEGRMLQCGAQKMGTTPTCRSSSTPVLLEALAQGSSS